MVWSAAAWARPEIRQARYSYGDIMRMWGFRSASPGLGWRGQMESLLGDPRRPAPVNLRKD
jgi:hypothetical protein